MYGVVLMVAMTGGAETPALGHRGGCCGGYSSCYGGGYGCCGGGKHHRRHHKCSGYSCCGGYSSCYGSYAGCCGGYGGYAGCTGGYGGYAGCTGGYGGYAGCYGGAPVMGGCYGAAPIAAPVAGTPGVITAPAQPAPPVPPAPPAPPAKKGKRTEKLKTPPDTGDETVAAPALITVKVPAQARLLIDGAATVSTAETRVFASPALESGKTYTYTLQAEFVRDGKNVVVTRNVQVRAGADVTISMVDADTTVASR